MKKERRRDINKAIQRICDKNQYDTRDILVVLKDMLYRLSELEERVYNFEERVK